MAREYAGGEGSAAGGRGSALPGVEETLTARVPREQPADLGRRDGGRPDRRLSRHAARSVQQAMLDETGRCLADRRRRPAIADETDWIERQYRRHRRGDGDAPARALREPASRRRNRHLRRLARRPARPPAALSSSRSAPATCAGRVSVQSMLESRGLRVHANPLGDFPMKKPFLVDHCWRCCLSPCAARRAPAWRLSTTRRRRTRRPRRGRPAGRLPDADPALWVVRDADTTIYLFGTFHLLDGRPWFNDEVKTAFDASSELVHGGDPAGGSGRAAAADHALCGRSRRAAPSPRGSRRRECGARTGR